MTTTNTKTRRRAIGLLTVALVAASLAGAAPAAASTIRSNVIVWTESRCGRLGIDSRAATNSAAIASLAPIRVYASDPSRNVPRTLVNTITSGSQAAVWTPVAPAAPSGVGPGLRIDIEWTGGSDSFTSEDYRDTCPGTFFPIAPTRVLDTRTDRTSPATVDDVLTIDPRTIAGVPATQVTALALNLTATQPLDGGFVTVWPCVVPKPGTSNLNFAAGQTVANLVVADLVGHPAAGPLCLASSVTTHLVVDVTGYFRDDQEPLPAGGRLTTLAAPRRALDTRGPVLSGGGQVRRVQLAGTNGVPPTNVFGVAVNVTAVNATSAGYATVYPCDAERPNASTVNYVPYRATPNAAIVGLGPTGDLCIFTLTDVDVLIDVMAFFGAGGVTLSVFTPVRWLDTRTSGVKVPAFTPTKLRLLVVNYEHVLNVTVTEPDSDGWLSVYPCDQPVPATSTVNFAAHANVANLALVRTVSPADICVYSTSDTHVVIDPQAYQSSSDRSPAS